MNNYYNPYAYNYGYQPMRQTPMQPPVQQPVATPTQPVTVAGLQGKTVDSIDVVKAMDIPLDGTVSYFPLVDGSAIITKQLQQDGTSKTLIYKVLQEETPVETKYITESDLNDILKKKDNKEIKDIKEDIKSLKRQFRDLEDDIKNKE